MKAKAAKGTVEARVADVLRVRLDGGQFFQIREYVREMEAKGEAPWAVPEGGKPLSDSQLRRYSRRADSAMAEASRASRGKLFREHVSRRLNLYARAINKGDERTALAVLRDLAELQGLYGDELTRQLEDLRQRVERLTGGDNGDGGGGACGVANPQPGAGPAGGGPAGDAAAGPAEGGPGGDLHGLVDDAGPLADGAPPQPLFPDAAAL
jgi:hypothetical protein